VSVWTGAEIIELVCTDRGRHPRRLISAIRAEDVVGTVWQGVSGRWVNRDPASTGLPYESSHHVVVSENRRGGRTFEVRCSTCKRSPRIAALKIAKFAATASPDRPARLDISRID